MVERLVIDPKLKSIPVLHNAQRVLVNWKWEIERSLMTIFSKYMVNRSIKHYLLIILIDDLTILNNFLFPWHYTVIQLYCVVLVVHIEFPKRMVEWEVIDGAKLMYVSMAIYLHILGGPWEMLERLQAFLSPRFLKHKKIIDIMTCTSSIHTIW